MATITVDADLTTVEIRDIDYDTFELSNPGDFIELDEVLEHEFGLERTSGWTSSPQTGEVFATARLIAGENAKDLS